MPKAKGPKGTKVTLKMAKKAIQTTPDGKRRLILSKMGITVFPKCILKLPNVDELDLSRNMIQKLPPGISDFSSLKWLDLHSNKLDSLPDSIGNLTELTYLNLCDNHLTSEGLPSSLGFLSNLKSLNLGMNQLDTLPLSMAELENLQELGLFDNRFISLPEFLNLLPSITNLNVKRNPLSDIDENGKVTLREESKPKENMYLVYEARLCAKCLKNCKEKKLYGEERGDGREGGLGDVREEKRIRTFSGLVTPNSVVRKVEHKSVK